METLDMLEEILINYEGTLLLVSHDRDFLDQTVTKVLAFEGDGRIEECIGGYSDYLTQKKSPSKKNDKKEQNYSQTKKVETRKDSSETKKLTYKLEYELKNLPKQIEDKEAEINTLTEKLSDGDFYKSDPDGFVEMTKELKLAKDQLEQYEERWLELEELSQ